MPSPSFLSFSQIRANLVISAQSLVSTLVSTGVGSAFGAILNIIADQTIYLSGIAQSILLKTRAATSAGADMDSYAADLGLTRLPAGFASGLATFTRYSAAQAALIPPGSIIKTVDGKVSFNVSADPTNSLWNAGLNGYLLPVGTAGATVPILAATPGAVGNVQAGSISLIVSGIAGIDLVSNPVALANGVDGESDDALRTRCWQYEVTRAQATQQAVEFAISTVQQGLSYQIAENVSADGGENDGSFIVRVDDGTGSPPLSLLSAITFAILPVKPLSVRFAVLPAVVVPATISMTIYAQAGYAKDALIGPVVQAVETYVQRLGVGAACAASNLIYAAMSVEGVAKIENLALNGGTFDIGGSFGQSVHVASCLVA